MNGVETGTTTATASQHEVATCLKNKAGSRFVTYSVAEKRCKRYTSQIVEEDISNSHTPETVPRARPGKMRINQDGYKAQNKLPSSS